MIFYAQISICEQWQGFRSRIRTYISKVFAPSVLWSQLAEQLATQILDLVRAMDIPPSRPPSPLSLSLDGNAEIPDLICARGETLQVLSSTGVLDTVFESKDHRLGFSGGYASRKSRDRSVLIHRAVPRFYLKTWRDAMCCTKDGSARGGTAISPWHEYRGFSRRIE